MKTLFFLLHLIFSSLLFAQESLDAISNDGRQSLLQNNATLDTSVNGQQLLQQVADVNQVFVQQIGENNVAITNVVSSKANVIIEQTGADNTVFSFYRAGTINSEIIQQGNSNSFFETVVGSSFQGVNSINSQIGNNLTLTKFGSNSISNNISINMTGNNRSISVLSF